MEFDKATLPPRAVQYRAPAQPKLTLEELVSVSGHVAATDRLGRWHCTACLQRASIKHLKVWLRTPCFPVAGRLVQPAVAAGYARLQQQGRGAVVAGGARVDASPGPSGPPVVNPAESQQQLSECENACTPGVAAAIAVMDALPR
eukprot:81893-Lingulodinium_polyedra.AAC.1